MSRAEEISVEQVSAQLEKTSLQAPSEHVFLDKVILNHLIHEIIFFDLTPLEFLRLAKTCRLAYAVVNAFVQRIFNINRFLSRFFPDPVDFRSLQARTSTLIAGSGALQFFDRTFYPTSDLDLYIPDQFGKEVGCWLLRCDYKFVQGPGQPADFERAVAQAASFFPAPPLELDYDLIYTMKGVKGVYTFSKASPSDPDVELKVQCIVVKRAPMEVILLFHSTCIMNIISYEKAYSLYPRASLHEHRSLICRMNPPLRQEHAMQKYHDRGFKMVTTTTRNKNGVDPGLPVGKRLVGDSECWVIPLDMEGVELPRSLNSRSTPFSQDPICIVTWELIVRPPLWVEIAFRLYTTKDLYFSYVAASDKPLVHAAKILRTTYNAHSDDHLPVVQRRRYDNEFIKVCLEYHQRD